MYPVKNDYIINEIYWRTIVRGKIYNFWWIRFLSEIKIIPKIKDPNPNEGLSEFTFGDFWNPSLPLSRCHVRAPTPSHCRTWGPPPSRYHSTSSTTVMLLSDKFSKPLSHFVVLPLSNDCHCTHHRIHASWLVLLHILYQVTTLYVWCCVCMWPWERRGAWGSE